MEIIKLRDEFIKLGQALKAAGLVESGVDAKLVILDGQVKVDRKSTRLNSSHYQQSRMPSSA